MSMFEVSPTHFFATSEEQNAAVSASGEVENLASEDREHVAFFPQELAVAVIQVFIYGLKYGEYGNVFQGIHSI